MDAVINLNSPPFALQAGKGCTKGWPMRPYTRISSKDPIHMIDVRRSMPMPSPVAAGEVFLNTRFILLQLNR
jgi:hypothetical protein